MTPESGYNCYPVVLIKYRTQCFICIYISSAFVWVMYGKKKRKNVNSYMLIYYVQRYDMFCSTSLIWNLCNCTESTDFTKCEQFFAVNTFSGMIYTVVWFSQKMCVMGYQVHAWSHI